MEVKTKDIFETEKRKGKNQSLGKSLPAKKFTLFFLLGLFVLAFAFSVFNSSQETAKFDEIVEKLTQNETLSTDEEAFFCQYLQVENGADCQSLLQGYRNRVALWNSCDLNDKILLLNALHFLSEADREILRELESETDKKGAEVNFGDEKKLCEDFNVKDMREYHTSLKRKLKNRFKEQMFKYLAKDEQNNPDFGVSKNGFVVFRSVKSKKTVNTGEKP